MKKILLIVLLLSLNVYAAELPTVLKFNFAGAYVRSDIFSGSIPVRIALGCPFNVGSGVIFPGINVSGKVVELNPTPEGQVIESDYDAASFEVKLSELPLCKKSDLLSSPRNSEVLSLMLVKDRGAGEVVATVPADDIIKKLANNKTVTVELGETKLGYIGYVFVEKIY